MTTLDVPENFSIGRTVSRTFEVLLQNLSLFVPLATLLTLPTFLLSLYLRSNPAFAALATGGRPGASLSQIAAQSGLVVTVSVIFSFIMQAAAVQGTITYLSGERPNLGQCLATGFKAFLPLVGIAILTMLGVWLGFLLLIVPGIMLLLAWSVVVPVRIVEQTGISQSFGRSRTLTKGHRWAILGLFLMYFLVAILISLGVRPLFGIGLFTPSPALLGLPYLTLNAILRVVTSGIGAVGIAAIYYELRLIKEGAGPDQLAAAFD